VGRNVGRCVGMLLGARVWNIDGEWVRLLKIVGICVGLWVKLVAIVILAGT
jgi:phage shock protein PspC (stress-responsive transcriptional regulator)